MKAAPALAIEALTIGFGAAEPVVRGVDLAIGPGERFGLVGESGSGKSTIAYAAMGWLPPRARVSGGRVRLAGRDLGTVPAREVRALRRGFVAMVPQEPMAALDPVMRVGRQLAGVASLAGSGDARGAVLDMLARVRLPEPEAIVARYPHQLSGGQAQRVAIAMALIARPRLLILDEPTTGLDATVARGVVDLITDLGRDRETAMLYISHDLGLIARVASRVGVIYAGEIVELGSARQVLKDPRHPYTQGLLACLPRIDGPRLARLPAIAAGPADAGDAAPRGCAFAPRCAHVRPGLCDAEPGPALMALGDGRAARCRRLDEIGRAAPAAGGRGRGARPEPAPLAAIEGLGKTYGRDPGLLGRLGGAPRRPTVALDAVSFGIGRGEVVGLVGESGSGKSTLARILVGLETADAGACRLDGADLARLPAARRPRELIRAVQIVFQNPEATLNPSHSVGRILARAIRGLGTHGRRAVRDRLASLLAMVRLDPVIAARRPAALSGGQRQRVAIARALAGAPKLVVADEAVSALDVSIQAAVVNLLADIRDEAGTAVLFISHDLAVVRHVADRVVVLLSGRVMESGPADAVFGRPLHPYTRTLLAAHHPPDPDPDQVPPPAPAGAEARAPQAGCPFAPACPVRIEGRCEREAPPRRPLAAGGAILCHHPPERLAAREPTHDPGQKE